MRRYIRDHQLIHAQDRVLIGVSGGPDSMALLHALCQLQRQLHIKVFAIHVHHHLREEEADNDSTYVQHRCREWGVPCKVISVNVHAYAEQHKVSKQVAARECRYQAFYRVAEEWECNKIAVAHHADDQVETVTMRLIRGTGLSGLTGIPLRREVEGTNLTIVRPLLSVKRMEIEDYCLKHDISPRHDSSNDSDAYTRNYIRHHVTPAMKELNPDIHSTISEMVDTILEEDRYMSVEAEKHISDILISVDEREARIYLVPLQRLPLALQRRVILLILNCLSERWRFSSQNWGKVHIDQILHVTKKTEGSQQLHLPGPWTFEREYEWLKVSKHADQSISGKRTGHTSDMLASLVEEGSVSWHVANTTYMITVKSVQQQSDRSAIHQTNPVSKRDEGGVQYKVQFDKQHIEGRLAVRTRRSGDKIQPLGMKGHKKVKDIFIDSKIPVSQRDKWPIIVDQAGILWIPGLKVAERGRCRSQSKDVIEVTVEKLREGQNFD